MLGRLEATLCSVLTWQRYAGTDGRCAHVGVIPTARSGGDGTFRLRKINPVIDPSSAPPASFVEMRWEINAVILAGPRALPGAGVDAVYYAGVHPAPPAPIRIELHQTADTAPVVHLPAFEYHVYALSTDGTLRILARDNHELTDVKTLTPYEWRGACNVADELMRLLRALDYRAWCSIVDGLNAETDRRLNTDQLDVGPVL